MGGTTSNLRDIWGSAADDIYVVGSAGMIHYDGTIWEPIEVPTSFALKQIYGTGPTDIYAVGGGAGFGG